MPMSIERQIAFNDYLHYLEDREDFQRQENRRLRFLQERECYWCRFIRMLRGYISNPFN